METRIMDLSKLLMSTGINSEEVEDQDAKHLLQLNKNLQELYDQYESKRDKCSELRKTIKKYEYQLEEMNGDIQILEELKYKLFDIPEYLIGQVEKFDELDSLIKRKRQCYCKLYGSLKQLYEHINTIRENLNSLHKRLESANQELKEKQDNLAIYDKWTAVLVNRARILHDTIDEMDEDLKSTIQSGTDVSDPVIDDLKEVVDEKIFDLDRKVRFYIDTIETLHNTKYRYNYVSALIETIREEIDSWEKLISQENARFDKLTVQKNSVEDMLEKTNTQWEQYSEMQESYNLKEKFRTTEELLLIHWKECCEIQEQVNINRNKLFSLSLDLSMLESDIALTITKKEELEAEIELRLTGSVE